MITCVSGDVFKSDAECLVNTVNCEGFMGKGMAYQFKRLFPENNKKYVEECKAGNLKPGKVLAFVEKGKTIINFPTKDKWRNPSKLSYISDGMKEMMIYLINNNIHSVAIPPLGCGNGGLNWDEVKEIILRHIKPQAENIDFYIYEPSCQSISPHLKVPSKMSPSALVLIRLRNGLKKENKLRLQKAAFMMNCFMKKEYFIFMKARYGPYSYVVESLSNNIGEYKKLFNLKSDELYSYIYNTICSKKTDFDLQSTEVPIEKALEFVNSIEDDHLLEGVSTVLYLVREGRKNVDDIWNGFIEWPEDKAKRFSKEDVLLYLNILDECGVIFANIVGEYEIV